METFKRRWGGHPGDHEPQAYWQPWLGHWFHLRPQDMQDLTPQQLDECVDFVEKARD